MSYINWNLTQNLSGSHLSNSHKHLMFQTHSEANIPSSKEKQKKWKGRLTSIEHSLSKQDNSIESINTSSQILVKLKNTLKRLAKD